jgi:hypothetical protein
MQEIQSDGLCKASGPQIWESLVLTEEELRAPDFEVSTLWTSSLESS